MTRPTFCFEVADAGAEAATTVVVVAGRALADESAVLSWAYACVAHVATRAAARTIGLMFMFFLFLFVSLTPAGRYWSATGVWSRYLCTRELLSRMTRNER